MRNNPTKRIEAYRVMKGPYRSFKRTRSGMFMIPYKGEELKVISSDGEGWVDGGMPGKPWEHVSVSLPDRCPTWEEMDYVKRIFWRDDECVLQFHVPRTDHINMCQTCLHLWKPIGQEIPKTAIYSGRLLKVKEKI